MESDSQKGKIGVFDSGLGGLVVLRELRRTMPEFEYVFFGDQKNLPFGNKSLDELFTIGKEALTYLFEQQDCRAVLIACNTMSANLYDRLKAWVLATYPEHYIFGIGKGTVDSLEPDTRFTVFGTERTVESHRYSHLLKERFTRADVSEIALPELCPRIESHSDIETYLQNFSDVVPREPGTAILACTHYGIVKESFQKVFPQFHTVVAQEEVLPTFFNSYLDDREHIRNILSVGGTLRILISADNPVFREYAKKWFSETQVTVC